MTFTLRVMILVNLCLGNWKLMLYSYVATVVCGNVQ